MWQALDLELYLLLPLALVLFLMALPVLSRKLYGKVDYVTPFELMKRLDAGENLAIVDLRPEKEFSRGHIEGSFNVSVKELEARINEKNTDFEAYKDNPLVLVCASDMHSIQAANKLKGQGFSNVSVVRGGINRWKRKHLPLGS